MKRFLLLWTCILQACLAWSDICSQESVIFEVTGAYYTGTMPFSACSWDLDIYVWDGVSQNLTIKAYTNMQSVKDSYGSTYGTTRYWCIHNRNTKYGSCSIEEVNVSYNGKQYKYLITGVIKSSDLSNLTSDYGSQAGDYWKLYIDNHLNYYKSRGIRVCKPTNMVTLTWKNYDGLVITTTQCPKGVTPVYSGTTPTKPADAQYTYTFAGWTPEVVAATGDATYTATFTAVPVPSPDSIYVHDGEDPNLCDLAAHSLSHVIIEPGGELNVDLSCVHVDVVTIISTGIHSGQIHHGSNPIPTNHMFMEYVLNPFGTSASPSLWYAFAVPFEVDIETGITRAYGSTSHISGTDFLIKEYDGNLRATTGKGWKSKLTGTLEPGHFYMIGIEGTCNRWLFEKKSEAAVEGDKHMQVKTYIANKAEYNNWNGLGNTRLEYSTMDLSGLGIEYILTYNSQFDKYDISLVSASTLCVGRPFFVQAISAGEFDFVHSSGSNNMPALYAQRDTKPLMQFTLTDETQSTGIDNMFLTMHKDADGTYTLGRDVARMSKNCKTAAQLWCTRPDGTELSAHGVAMPETETIVPITLFAPNEGSYFLNASTNAMAGYDIELLQNGAQIAIFSDAQPIKLDLNAGTNSGYSLRISRRDMPEGIDDVQREEIQSTKVIINDHLYILRAGHMYDAQGKQVK